ncbi:WD40 repeat-like protein [Gloeophyllum trabeum ATCC 11539]|uniref:WD40 repeat-like protein n=1 Tax=Gloeophyllum trabeum (strain ATCC 11539 / FP-39264 / Madison 617) TaxID=670483 RepID=S7QK11_GLOTA|nr:WD40 repeat-like protein [Gloeophyllum trabeum ATCC 11539]EPQ60061.1 WD40 repeat-like protein [Gloeophyllum trabeum ATCC 11539]
MAPWRQSPGKLRTAHAALILCLNIDVDPPDVVKTNPCAVLECWVDPHSMPSNKALEAIGENLRHQYEGLSPKITYKAILDPWYEDLRRYCVQFRRGAKEDAVLFHYNGHGVPKPTPSGELWCFNKQYTQYIPVSLADIQTWLGSPSVYIWDCSAAGHLLQNFNAFAEDRDKRKNLMEGGYPEGQSPFSESIQLAACAAHETLPSCPELPADLFTSCLTSPIDIALRYFVMNHQLPNNITADMVMQLPGDLKDRRTPLGELNWIFIAITDTIAWTTFPRELFTRLYRSDLLIASLFRNFLLAERIMKNYHCTPHTSPPLPPTNTHRLWASWDLAVDACLRQLPDLLAGKKSKGEAGESAVARSRRQAEQARQDRSNNAHASADSPYTYIPSRFFADQLTAFEVWISRGGSALTKRGPMSLPVQTNGENGAAYAEAPSDAALEPQPSLLDQGTEHHLVPRKPPEQLPIVLQVLLSQPHRLRALILLSQFVDLGPWAVHLALTIGIFPYISKLLQAAGQDLRPVLIFIWARILAVDPTCQVDLYTNQGYKYFANVLAIQEDPQHSVIPNHSEHKAMCAFILSAIARDFAHGQTACWRERVFDNCFERLDEGDFLLRQWCALCIAQIWDGNDEIKIYGVDRGTQDKLIAMLSDDSPEVRTAALYALGTFMGSSGSADPNKCGGGGSGTMQHLEERIHFRMEVAVATGATLAVKDDASPTVRKELLVLISCLAKEWRGYFVVCAWIYWEENRRRVSGMSNHMSDDDDVAAIAVSEWLDSFGDDEGAREENRVLLSSFFTIFVALLELSTDPYQEVATNAQTVVDYVMALLLESPFTRLDSTSLHVPPPPPPSSRVGHQHNGTRSRVSSIHSSPSQPQPYAPIANRPQLNRSETMTSAVAAGVTSTLRRTSSFANALKSLAGNIAFPSTEDGRSTPSTPAPPRLDMPDISRAPSPNLNFAQYTSPYSRPPSPDGAFLPPPSPVVHHPQDHHAPADFMPWDVMEALMEEDMERLRARRRAGTQVRRHVSGAMSSPSGSTFSVDSGNSSVILGLGTGAGIRDSLPLKSRFYDWCCEYFKEPQMRQAEADEPGSVQYNYQVWRQQRNEQILTETQSQVEVAETRRWTKHITTLQVGPYPLTTAFHMYDPHLVVASDTDTISVWDWQQRRRLALFYNGNPKGTSITSLHFINQDVGGIILATSADGVVRLYRNYDPALTSQPVQMVSSFRGLNELVQTKRGSGVITDWKQNGGSLMVGGDSRVIRVWDAHTESLLMDLETKSDSPITSMASDPSSSPTFLAGFADGTVNLFDRRLPEEDAIVRSYCEHVSWIQNTRWHPTLSGKFLSASLDGEVKIWDLRADAAINNWEMFPHGLSAFDVHPQAGVFAALSAVNSTQYRTQRATVQSLTLSAVLSSVDINTGLTAPTARHQPSPFIPRSSSLVFHPTEMVYAIGPPDGSLRILGCKIA